MFPHCEPLGNVPIEEVRAMPFVYPQTAPTNTLFSGDNLPILRGHIGDASVDLVCPLGTEGRRNG